MLVSGRVNGNKHICYCFSNHFIRLLLQATETPHLTNYGLRLFNPSSLQDDFCYLQQPSVPNRWVSWSPGTFAPWWKNQPTCRAANCWPKWAHISPGEKTRDGKVKRKSPLFGGCCALDPWMLCRDQHRWQQPLQISLILMKGRPLNHQLADHHLPSILILVSNARNLHNSRIRLGE